MMTVSNSSLLWPEYRLVDEECAKEYGIPEEKINRIVDLSKRVKNYVDEDENKRKDSSELLLLTDPTTLLRFLDAREGIVDDAEQMILDTLKWRKEFHVNELMNEWGRVVDDDDKDHNGEGVWCLDPQSERSKVACRHFYGVRLSEKAKDGSPVILQRMGKADFNGIVRENMEDLMLNSFVVMLEDAFRAGRNESLKRKQLVRAAFVIDAKGLGSAVLRHMSLIKQFSTIGKTYYAEVSRTVTIINAPWIFATIWKMIRPLLPQASRDKVQIVGSSFHPILETHGNIDVKLLPESFDDVCPTDVVPPQTGNGLNLSPGGLLPQGENAGVKVDAA